MLSGAGARVVSSTSQEVDDDHGGAAIRCLPSGALSAPGFGRLLARLRTLIGGCLQQEASAALLGSAERGPVLYLVATSILAALLMGALATANYRLAPLSYGAAALARVAETLAGGSNYAVFDLNLDMRELRRQQIARLAATPEVVLLGASHWQHHSTARPAGRRSTPNC